MFFNTDEDIFELSLEELREEFEKLSSQTSLNENQEIRLSLIEQELNERSIGQKLMDSLISFKGDRMGESHSKVNDNQKLNSNIKAGIQEANNEKDEREHPNENLEDIKSEQIEGNHEYLHINNDENIKEGISNMKNRERGPAKENEIPTTREGRETQKNPSITDHKFGHVKSKVAEMMKRNNEHSRPLVGDGFITISRVTRKKRKKKKFKPLPDKEKQEKLENYKKRISFKVHHETRQSQATPHKSQKISQTQDLREVQIENSSDVSRPEEFQKDDVIFKTLAIISNGGVVLKRDSLEEEEEAMGFNSGIKEGGGDQDKQEGEPEKQSESNILPSMAVSIYNSDSIQFTEEVKEEEIGTQTHQPTSLDRVLNEEPVSTNLDVPNPGRSECFPEEQSPFSQDSPQQEKYTGKYHQIEKGDVPQDLEQKLEDSINHATRSNDIDPIFLDRVEKNFNSTSDSTSSSSNSFSSIPLGTSKIFSAKEESEMDKVKIEKGKIEKTIINNKIRNKDSVMRLYLGYSSNIQMLKEHFQNVSIGVLKKHLEDSNGNYQKAYDSLMSSLLPANTSLIERVDYSHLYTSILDIFTSHNSLNSSGREYFQQIRYESQHIESCFVSLLDSLEAWPIDLNHSSRYFRIQQCKEEVYDIVVNVMQELGDSWSMIPQESHSTWNLLWTWKKPTIERSKLLVWQKVNHFCNAKELTRKDLLAKHLAKYRKNFGKAGEEFNIMPLTFNLPQQYVEFADEYGKSPCLWIMKPSKLSRGRGIKIIDNISKVNYTENTIIQKYIEKPLLLNDYKFDLRIYVLVTSLTPLEAYIYEEGFARYCSEKFSLLPENLNNSFVHLTNTSIQQYSQHSSVNKTSLNTLKIRLMEKNIDYSDIWNKIIEVVVKALCCVEEYIGSSQHTSCKYSSIRSNSVHSSSRLQSSTTVTKQLQYSQSDINSFELFGFDLILDENLKVWLLEVNSSPSMEVHSKIDHIKHELILDTIQLVNPVPFDRSILKTVIERRLSQLKKSKSRCGMLSQDELNHDLTRILQGKFPRQYGEIPTHLGKYKRIAPSPTYTKYSRLKKT